MSAEGGELTFVRCPSCRSLVPAVSTRCRWCGNSLGGSSTDSPKDETPARRVRQKTRSIQAGEYVPQPTREKGSQGTEEDSLEEDYDLDDPLKGFIEEVEEEEITDEEILSSLAEVEEESNKSNGVHVGEDDSSSEELPFNFSDQDEVDEGMDEDSELVSFADNFSEADDEVQAPEVSVPIASSNNEMEEVYNPRLQPQRFSPQKSFNIAKKTNKRVEEDSPDLSAKQTEGSIHKTGGEMNKTQYEANVGGKLYGWLVSYSTAEGRAFELREGRFFISGSPLKGNDFVINDPSVSTPHAMVNISRAGGFAIQDLMSDRGVFIRRRGQDTYQREDGIAKCSTGDWIRIGDVEYLLTVVADVSR